MPNPDEPLPDPLPPNPPPELPHDLQRKMLARGLRPPHATHATATKITVYFCVLSLEDIPDDRS